MRWNQRLSDTYYRNGYILVVEDIYLRMWRVIIHKNQDEEYGSYASRKMAVSIAKDIALDQQLKFNPKEDVIE